MTTNEVWGEPAPVPNDGPSMHDLVIQDLASRKAFGLAKYATILQSHNGRDPSKDAYEEVLDLVCYLRQTMIEFEAQKDEIDALRRRVASVESKRDEWQAESTRFTLLLCEVAECLSLEHDDVLLAKPDELRVMVNQELDNRSTRPVPTLDSTTLDLIDDAVTQFWRSPTNWTLIPPTAYDADAFWDIIVNPLTGQVWDNAFHEVPADELQVSWAVRLNGAKRTPTPLMPPPEVDAFDYQRAYMLTTEAMSIQAERDANLMRRLDIALNGHGIALSALPSMATLVNQAIAVLGERGTPQAVDGDPVHHLEVLKRHLLEQSERIKFLEENQHECAA